MSPYNSGETNIISPPIFALAENYSKFDIVYFTGHEGSGPSGPSEPPYVATQAESGHYYYISNAGSQSNYLNSPDSSGVLWTQDFFGQPSYGAKVNYSNDYYKTEFGDGYYNYVSKSVNSLKVSFDLSFNKRSDKEAKAIVHFLEDSFNKGSKPSGGYTGIYWEPFAPYSLRHEFYCENINWNSEAPNVSTVSTSFFSESKATTDWQNFYIPFSNTSGFFNTGNLYEKHDIVYASGSDFFFATSGWYYYTGDSATTSDSSNRPAGASSLWTKNTFYWDLNDGVEITEEPRLHKQTFQNAFFVREKDGINKNFLELSLSLKGRSDKEAKSIVHFLEKHRGSDQFLFTPPNPYNKQKPFVSPSWSHTLNFKDNNEINVNFLEQPIDYLSENLVYLDLVTIDPYLA